MTVRPAALAAVLLLASCRSEETPMPPLPTAAPQFVERTAPAGRPSPAGQGPLLVMLHGIGADEHDLFDLAQALDPRLVAVTLRAPRRYGPGYSWFDIAFGPDGQVTPDLEQARAALRDLIAWLRAAPARFGTDPRRTYLLGFSQGAMMTLGVLHTAPDLLAGAIVLSGRFPGNAFSDGGSIVDAMAAVPVFLAHGTHDDVLPIANGRQAHELLQPRIRDLTYREYPVGHGIGDIELRDIAAWLQTHLGD